MTVLEARDLVAGYGDARVLQGVSLEVRAGEVVSVLGPNGAGKSTLLKVIVGLLHPSEGTVRFHGEDITGVRPERLTELGIAYVPQLENVFPSLTVRENLELIFPAGTPRARVAGAVERIFDTFPSLRARVGHRARLLSGGERQQLAIARSMALDPRLVILDEPLAAVAPVVADEMVGYVRRIAAGGTPVLLVEQNARRALSISNRAYILDGGTNAMTGTGRELLEDPDVGRLYLGGGVASGDR